MLGYIYSNVRIYNIRVNNMYIKRVGENEYVIDNIASYFSNWFYYVWII